MKNNETILITGATSGFGRATALLCAKLGARVIAIGRRENLLTELKSEAGGKNIITVVHDISKDDPKDLLENKIPNEDITVLVNNAGLSLGFDNFQNGKYEDFNTVIDTNVKGTVKMTHAVIQGMLKRKKGYIINISSIAANYASKYCNIYGATKAFIKMFSLNLRADLHGMGLRVTDIEPGIAETEFSITRFKGDKEKAKNMYKGMKPINSEDIAETIAWLIQTPEHMNVNFIEIMPTCQSFGIWEVDRKS